VRLKLRSQFVPSHFLFPCGPTAVRVDLIMNNALVNPCWSTASFGDTADTSPMELSALGEHLNLCNDSHGHLFALHCMAQTLHGFVAPRLITTLVVAALLIGIVSMAL